MAKEILQGILAAAATTPDGTSIELDVGDVEGTLRGILLQGSSYAQPLAAFCVILIEEALNSVSSKRKTVADATSDGFAALTALDNLVCSAAKTKAELTAARPAAAAREINAEVKGLVNNKAHAGLPPDMTLKVLDLVLSIIDGSSTGTNGLCLGPQQLTPWAKRGIRDL